MKPFIVIILIFRRRYQVQDSPSWLPHTKIMQHSGRPSFAGLMLPYECRGWLNHTYISWHSGTEVCLCLSNEADADDFILWLVGFFHKVCLGKRFFLPYLFTCLTLANRIFKILNASYRNLILKLSSVRMCLPITCVTLCFIFLIQ